MILDELKIYNLRTVVSAQIHLHPHFNFFIGPNGSGKTSVLEALYLLSCGHSFRTREISVLVSHEQDSVTVFARAIDDSTISIQKSKSSPTQIKLNNQFCFTTSQLAYALPCQIIYADIFQVIDAGSSIRRSVLDWGLFHVKPNYLYLLKEYRRILKQRNSLLKQSSNYEHFIPWDKQLSLIADELDNLRKGYFSLWEAKFYEILKQLTSTQCTLSYYKGWDKKKTGKPLDTILAEQFSSDKQRLYTYYGPHYADLIIESDEYKAKQSLSRGQQKIILIALKLAQAALLNKHCLYLFDDLPSELDESHQLNLLNYCTTLTGQFIFTSTQDIAAVRNHHLSVPYSQFTLASGSVRPKECFT